MWQKKHKIEDEEQPTPEELYLRREVFLAELDIVDTEDTLLLIELAEHWLTDPEDVAQIVGEALDPGATFGETVTRYLFEAELREAGIKV